MTYAVCAQKTIAIAELDNLPTGWRIEPLCAFLQQSDVRNTGNIEGNLLSLSYGKIVRRDISSNDGLLPESFDTYTIVEPTDIVLRLTDLQNDKRSLRLGYVPERGIITSAYLALKVAGRENARFCYYVLHAYDLMKIFYGLGGGVRQSIKYADVKWLPMALPPVEYQSHVADFLDRETAKVDALVTKYERLLELLEEKRVALITQSVTKGLNPDAPMKNSGVEWIGKIPAHWTVKQVRHIADAVRTGGTPDESLRMAEGIPWFKPGDFNDDLSLSEPNEYVDPTRSDAVSVFPTGSVLIVGIGATIGKIGMARNACTSNQQINAVAPQKVMVPRFLAYAFAGLGPSVLRMLSNSSTLPILTQSDVKSIKIALAPIIEQATIADYLDPATKNIFQTQSSVRRAIALTRERCSALITAAVTGQIDVRTYKAISLEEIVA